MRRRRTCHGFPQKFSSECAKGELFYWSKQKITKTINYQSSSINIPSNGHNLFRKTCFYRICGFCRPPSTKRGDKNGSGRVWPIFICSWKSFTPLLKLHTNSLSAWTGSKAPLPFLHITPSDYMFGKSWNMASVPLFLQPWMSGWVGCRLCAPGNVIIIKLTKKEMRRRFFRGTFTHIWFHTSIKWFPWGVEQGGFLSPIKLSQ